MDRRDVGATYTQFGLFIYLFSSCQAYFFQLCMHKMMKVKIENEHLHIRLPPLCLLK